MNLHGALTKKRSLSFQQYVDLITLKGNQYLVSGSSQTLGSKHEPIGSGFQAYAQAAYKQNGIVFACMQVRMAVFSEARFQFRRRVLGRPGSLFGTAALKPLEEPWPGATTGDLLDRVIQDVDLGGNFFAHNRGGWIRRMRPDWVTIVLGSPNDPDVGSGDLDAEVLGYIYEPGGPGGSKDPETFLREEVAHFAPIPDPLASYRGMSWLTPVLREIEGDLNATEHKINYFENGATPNLVVTLDGGVTDQETFQKWVDMFEEEHGGIENAYKTLYLAGGSKAEVVGSDLKNIDFKAVQGAGETRIAAAAGVHPVVVGLSEALAGSSLNAGNYGHARRRFADATMRPLWRGVAGAFAPIIAVPPGAELWYDSRDIPFLQEDEQDKATIQSTQATAIKALTESGYDPDSVIQFIENDDPSRLKHSGLHSVQLQPAGSESQPSELTE